MWAAFSSTGVADGTAQPGEFHAFDAADVSRELRNSNQNSSRDYSGSFAKWCPPTVVNGKVYLGSFDNVLNVYGLLSSGQTISQRLDTAKRNMRHRVYHPTPQATVKDVNNNPLSGVTVTFTAPATGASAAFRGSITAMAVTNASGIATAPALTANGVAEPTQ